MAVQMQVHSLRIVFSANSELRAMVREAYGSRPQKFYFEVTSWYHFRPSGYQFAINMSFTTGVGYLTIIPRARMGYESIAHSAFGLMGY